MVQLARGAGPTSPDMTLGAHIHELQSRLIKAGAGIAAGLVVGWLSYEPIFQLLQRPMVALSSQGDRLVAVNFSGLGSAFTVQLKVALFVGLIVSAPWWAYQLWAYVRPGLLSRERKYAAAVIAAALPLFLAGAMLAWFVLPSSVAVLTSFAPDFTATMINAEVYFDFVLRMIVAFGLAFVLPVIMVGATAMGLVGSGAWLKGWRWAVLVAFLFAAVASPSGDVLTMTALGAPICGLYALAIGVCVLWERRLIRQLERPDATRLTR